MGRNCRNATSTNPKLIAVRELGAKALELRKEGHSFTAIAKTVGYNSASAAHYAVKSALDRITREPAEELISLELERLDELFKIQYLNAQAGDTAALNGCLKILERRARMLGLDADKGSGMLLGDSGRNNGVRVEVVFVRPSEQHVGRLINQTEEATK